MKTKSYLYYSSQDSRFRMIAAQMLPNYRREREATVQETLAFCAGFRDKRRATRKTARKIGPFVSSPAISHKRHGIFR